MPSNPDEQIRRAAKERERAKKLAEQVETAERRARCELFTKEVRQALSRLEAKGWPGAEEVRVATTKWSRARQAGKTKITLHAGWKVGEQLWQQYGSGGDYKSWFLLADGRLVSPYERIEEFSKVIPDALQSEILSGVQQLGR